MILGADIGSKRDVKVREGKTGESLLRLKLAQSANRRAGLYEKAHKQMFIRRTNDESLDATT